MSAKETLEKLRDYSAWMYYDPAGIQKFLNLEVKVDGIEYKINLLKDGRYQLQEMDSDKFIVVDPYFKCDEIQNGIDNVKYGASLGVVEGMSEEDLKRFEDVAIFVGSAFQRAVAFTFFARMTPESIEQIATALDSIS